MPAANIIPFPKRWHASGFQRGHVHLSQRATVRFLGPAAGQMSLALPPDASLEARILSAKATIANYDDLAAASRPSASSLYRRFAVVWELRLAGLLAEKAALAVQTPLPLASTP